MFSQVPKFLQVLLPEREGFGLLGVWAVKQRGWQQLCKLVGRGSGEGLHRVLGTTGIKIHTTDRGALPWHWVVAGVGGEQREAWVSQQEGFFSQGGFMGRGTNPLRWLWGGREGGGQQCVIIPELP